MKLALNHIPKTGGTSLFSIFITSYDNYLSLNRYILSLFSSKQLISLLSSSDFIQFHAIEVMNRNSLLINYMLNNCYFFSIVRHPIDRLISLWNHQWESDNFWRGFLCNIDCQPKDEYCFIDPS